MLTILGVKPHHIPSVLHMPNCQLVVLLDCELCGKMSAGSF